MSFGALAREALTTECLRWSEAHDVEEFYEEDTESG